MKFTKMHGLGNDYIYINEIEEKYEDFGKLAIILSDRHTGIGADGIITISSSNKADYFMQIYNADGSKGEMCGNGIRCVGKYVYDNGLTSKTHLKIDTLAGIKSLDLNIVNGKVDTVKVDMGRALSHDGKDLDISKITHNLSIDGVDFEVIDISMGNPHTVIFVDELTDELVLGYGSKIESNSYYPNRTNVEFVKVIDENTIAMRVYERGSGETMACGTGACASAVAYMLKKENINNVTVKLLGGDLFIKKEENNHIVMEGTATKVFDGEIENNTIKEMTLKYRP